jgi:integrase
MKLTENAIRAARPEAGRVTELYDDACPGLFLRVQPSGLRTFYVNLPGKRRVALGRYGNVTLEAARDLARTMLAEARIEKLSPAAAAAAKVGRAPTLRRFLDDRYAPWVLAHRKDGAGTVTRLNDNFATLMRQHLHHLDAAAVEKWRTERLATGVSAATVNRDLTALRAVLSKAVEWGVLPRHPMTAVKQLATDDDAEPRWLTPEEVARLRATLCRLAVSGRNMDVLAGTLVLLNTGLRRGELVTLTPAAIDLKRRRITVRGSLSKTGKTRVVPLNDEAAAALALWPAPYPHPAPTIWTAFKRTFRAARIAAGPHALRHTFARRLIDAGVPLPDVAALLGHASVTTTMRYVRADAKGLAAAVSKISFSAEP